MAPIYICNLTSYSTLHFTQTIYLSFPFLEHSSSFQPQGLCYLLFPQPKTLFLQFLPSYLVSFKFSSISVSALLTLPSSAAAHVTLSALHSYAAYHLSIYYLSPSLEHEHHEGRDLVCLVRYCIHRM